MLPVVRSYAKEQRAGVLLVEQHVPLALGVADRAYVLARGSIVLSGDARDLRSDVHALMASYLGEPPAVRSGALETDRGEASRNSAISS
jgi:branched-chain amino acid transport system ATP-binding protein